MPIARAPRSLRHVLAALASVAAPALGSGCGVALDDYNARVSELRKATELVQQCQSTSGEAKQSLEDAESGLAEMKARILQLETERASLGAPAAEVPGLIKRLRDDDARAAKLAAARKDERARMQRGLKEELEAGVVWLDDRAGAARVVIPEEVLFASGSATLGVPGRKVLDAVAREIKQLPPRRLVVAAYLDARPEATPAKAAAAVGITVDRARRVTEYLVKQGMEPDRIGVAGHGPLDPVADNATDDGRTRNRRVEVQLYEPITPAAKPAPAPAPAAPVAKPAPAPAPKPAPPAKPAPALSDDPGL